MAAMNSVEVADGNDGAPGFFGNITRSVNRDHLRRSSLHESRSRSSIGLPQMEGGRKEIIIASQAGGGQSWAEVTGRLRGG